MSAPHVHVNEDAELYALGALGDDVRDRIDALTATCDECAARVGEAERTVARMVQPANVAPELTQRMHDAFASPARWRRRSPWLAVAAAFVIGILPSAYFLASERNMQTQLALQSAALPSLIHSHFVHASFVPTAPNAPAAKAISARDGSWIYVLCDGTHDYTVVAQPGGVVLGRLRAAGAASVLYRSRVPYMSAIELRDGAIVVARAVIVTTSEKPNTGEAPIMKNPVFGTPAASNQAGRTKTMIRPPGALHGRFKHP